MKHRPVAARNGVVLLEVLIALVILGSAGIASVALASGVSRSMARARDRDDDVRAACAFLDDVALWSRDDLDRHLGQRKENDWTLWVDHPWPSVYAVKLFDAGSSSALLETFLYKPDQGSSDAP